MSKKNISRKISSASNNSKNSNDEPQQINIPTSNPNDVLDREVSVPGKIEIILTKSEGSGM
jgi:hypothetical protein